MQLALLGDGSSNQAWFRWLTIRIGDGSGVECVDQGFAPSSFFAIPGLPGPRQAKQSFWRLEIGVILGLVWAAVLLAAVAWLAGWPPGYA